MLRDDVEILRRKSRVEEGERDGKKIEIRKYLCKAHDEHTTSLNFRTEFA